MKRAYSLRVAAVIAVFLCLFLSDAYADLIINSGETFVLNPANSEVISIDGDLIIANNGNLQGGNNTEIRVNGDWDNSANGSFTHANTKVVFTGSGISSIKGNNQFHHLVINKKETDIDKKFTGTEIQIEAGTTQTISSQLFLNGAAVDDRLSIRSTINGVSHALNASSAVYVEAWFLDIDDSVFIGEIDMPTILDSSSITAPIVGSGNNDGWIPNGPPTAEAGPDQLSVDSASIVTLDGLGSSDIDNGDTLTYVWTQSSGTAVTLSSTTADKPTFTAPTLGANEAPQTLVFSLRVIDNKGLESVDDDTVTITVVPPSPTVTISETADQNQTLSLVHNLSNSDNLGEIVFQWLASDEDIVGMTQTTYVPTQDQVGKIVSVRVSYTNYQGEAKSVLSNSTAAVENVNDAPQGRVWITGIVGVDQILTANNDIFDADGLGVISYQWLADGVNIVNANHNTYQLIQTDINKTITVVALYTDAYGEQESVISENTTTEILTEALDQLAVDRGNNSHDLYVAAGITGVSETNLNSINDAFKVTGVTAQIEIQQLVDSYNVILDFAENDLPGATPPSVGDYRYIGITGITQNSTVLSLLSDVIELGDAVDVDSISKLQALTNAVLALYDQAENETNELSKDQLELLGVESVTNDNLSDIRLLINETNQQLDQVAIIQILVDKVVASHVIHAYNADQISNLSPTLDTYLDLDLNNISASNLEEINNAISNLPATAIDSIEKITTVLTVDTDSDNVIDIIDSFPLDASETLDTDGDNFGDNSDNCPNIPNQLQLDFDSDSLGDACDPDEDGDGVVSSDDAFKFNSNYSTDTDNDGMPNAFEEQYGFDVNNSMDKTTDSDGDGVTNLDEFLAGTNPRINPNPGLPQLVIPDDIEMISTGRMTAVDIGAASAIDGSNRQLQPVASFTGPFSAGRHEIVWSATDALGNQSKAVQVVKVLPLINLTPSSLIAEGGTVEVSAILSGDAADYPVRIPYEISGSAENSVDYQIEGTIGVIAIEQGREASFSIEIMVDDEPENDETIDIKLESATNAVLGSVIQRTISIIDGNLPPKISVIVEQGDNLGRVIAADKGAVTITAEISDPNPEDSHSFDWQLESEQTSAVVSETTQDHKKILVIDPSQLKPGVFSIAAKATDSADIVATTEVKTDFRLMEAAPDLSAEIDSDGDGVSDADEGYDDSDNDGIVDYMDNIVEPNLAPVSEDSMAVLQAAVGTQVILGEMAFSNAESTVMVSKQQVVNIVTKLKLDNSLGVLDKNYTYPYGLYDFVVSGKIPGSSYYLVLPLKVPFEEGQVFRKYMGPQVGWQNFVENANNLLFSSVATEGACPEPGSSLFVNGLQLGHNCIQLYIEDGGPNDLDGIADGIVTDPGGIAIFSQQGGGAPSAANSSIELERTILATEGDKTLITVRVFDENNAPLEGVNIVATCDQCKGVTIGEFSYQQQGVYTAFIVSGNLLSNAPIKAVITNVSGSITLESKRLAVTSKRRGGCTIVEGQPTDISLIMILFLITLFNYCKCRIDDHSLIKRSSTSPLTRYFKKAFVFLFK